jgi:hypothetical protein
MWKSIPRCRTRKVASTTVNGVSELLVLAAGFFESDWLALLAGIYSKTYRADQPPDLVGRFLPPFVNGGLKRSESAA